MSDDGDGPIDISDLQAAVQRNAIFFTDHALRQMARRHVSVDEVKSAIMSGTVIESYPDDKYSPSCLVFGTTIASRALHVVCSAPPRVRIVTVYEPDPDEWIDHRTRRAT